MRSGEGATVVLAVAMLALSTPPAGATPFNIVHPGLTHFANFDNDPPAGPISAGRISEPTAAWQDYDFGWHNSPSGLAGGPQYAGVLAGGSYVVNGLRFQVHSNPFMDFVLQGSNDTTTGLDGLWSDLLSSTVVERGEWKWQEWSFPNNAAFTAFRVEILSDYPGIGGYAMYRWQLLGEPATVPEPSSTVPAAGRSRWPERVAGEAPLN